MSSSIERVARFVALLAVKLGMAWIAVHAWVADVPVSTAVVITVLALLCWATVRQVLRYTLAVAGMAVVRELAVRAGRLEEPGGITDPDAPWRVWLNQRCVGCGY